MPSDFVKNTLSIYIKFEDLCLLLGVIGREGKESDLAKATTVVSNNKL